MAPENEGKPLAGMSSRTVEVFYEALAEIENHLMKMQVQMEDICSSDVLSNLPFEGDSNSQRLDCTRGTQLNCSPEAVRALQSKQETVKDLNELVLLKLRNIIPRQKGSGEDLSSGMNLKRSRPLSSAHPPFVPSITGPLDSKLGILGGADSPRGNHGTTFDIASPASGEPVHLKFIKIADNTKSPFHKPPIFMPTAKVGVPNLDPSTMPLSGNAGSSAGRAIGKSPCLSLKKRPKSSKRDRTKSKLVEVPEPVIRKLNPGDTSKIPEDGFQWRKYGNKSIKTASYKRGYYRCSHFKEKCIATKIVQPTDNDPATFSVCYMGKHTCKQQGNGDAGTSGLPLSGGQDNMSSANRVNGNPSMGDPEDVEKDCTLEGLECASGDNLSDSASEDVFAPSEVGEEAVESVGTPAKHAEPSSPLIDFEMPNILDMHLHCTSTEINVEQPSPWCDNVSSAGDFKVKYQPSETCPLEGQEINQSGLVEDGNDQLLKWINGGLLEHPSDINYWCGELDSLPYSHVDLLQF